MKRQKAVLNIYLIYLILISPVIAYAQIERGAGTPIVDVFAPTAIKEGEYQNITVNVKNIGDSDGFNIILDSKTGKLLVGVGSYTSQYIPAGEEKKFEFNVRVAGRMYTGTASDSILSTKEDVELSVTPEHNIDARVIKNISIDISYKPIEGVTPKASGFQVIYTVLGITLIALLLRKRTIFR